jgi:hypothetical protein
LANPVASSPSSWIATGLATEKILKLAISGGQIKSVNDYLKQNEEESIR